MKKAFTSVSLAICLAAPVLTGLSGCAGSRYERSTGEHIDDRSTTSRVKSALRDDREYKYPDVMVKTFKGTVQLSGFVNSREQKTKAGELVKKVPGVKELANDIIVKE